MYTLHPCPFQATGSMKDLPMSGRPKGTTQQEARNIAVAVGRRRFVNGPRLERMMTHQRPKCSSDLDPDSEKPDQFRRF